MKYAILNGNSITGTSDEVDPENKCEKLFFTLEDYETYHQALEQNIDQEENDK